MIGNEPDKLKINMKPIYVIVDVTYDWYRFQDNLGATPNLKRARKIAAEAAKGRPVVEDVRESQNMDEPETKHILIETWNA